MILSFFKYFYPHMVLLLPETASQLAADTALDLPPHISYEQLESLLALKLESMINKDFQQFVLLLYKIDVAEEKVRQVLESDITPGVYQKIAALLIERQQQKIISRKHFSKPPGNEDDEDKW